MRPKESERGRFFRLEGRAERGEQFRGHGDGGDGRSSPESTGDGEGDSESRERVRGERERVGFGRFDRTGQARARLTRWV